jgi:eukaryotic-like serine/threonine-protein kinase
MEAERLGRYEIVRHLAHGGMASVYLARLSGIGGFERHVVLKTLRGDAVADDALVPMFLDEARLVAQLHHQHIAQVFDVGHDGETYYLAMEYVHGETVRAVLEAAWKQAIVLPLDFALTVVCAAAAALHHAHERCDRSGQSLDIVHRDVTPSNVIVSYDGSIKLIDFGIAKANLRMAQTRTGFIKGKAGYMAPEQVKGHPIDRRSDVFALGVLAYELTTQRRAFHCESQFEQLQRIAHATIAPPSHVMERYPVELEQIVMRALEVDPDDRYQDAATMRGELERIANKLGLVLGEDSVIGVLDALYGQRPEPWLLTSGSIDYDVTPQVEDVPFSLELGDGKIARSATVPLAGVTTEPVALEDILGETPHPPPPLTAAELAVVPQSARFDTGISARRRRRGVLLLALLGCAALGVAAALLISYFVLEEPPVPAVMAPAPAKPRPAPAKPAPVKPAPVKPVPTPPKPAALAIVSAPRPDKVVLDVITDPPDATVVLDGVRLGHTPYHAEVAIKNKPVWLKVRRFDRVARKIKVTLDRDVEWSVKLPARRGF